MVSENLLNKRASDPKFIKCCGYAMDFFKHFEIQWKAVDSVSKMRHFLPFLMVKGRKLREAADCSTRTNQVVNKLKERKQMSPTQRTSVLFKRSSKNFLELMLKLLL